jgi:hypothetical protein
LKMKRQDNPNAYPGSILFTLGGVKRPNRLAPRLLRSHKL